MRDGAATRAVEPGDVLFVLFALGYAALSVALIPFDFQDLCYLFSLEQGRWVMQEWVHPIYVPVLDLFRRGLAWLGYRGPMLVPIELLNVVAAILAFAFLYRLARRFPRSALAAVLTLSAAALSYGFWHATVRPTPYALAFLSQVLSLLLLISDQPVPRSRYALAGALAGVSMGFHASAMALGVVGVVSALAEPERTAAATRQRIAAFAGTMLATAVSCWIVLMRYRAIGSGFFLNQDFRSMFFAIEQMPGSSIYTSGSVIEQVSTFAESLRFQGGGLLRAAIVVGLVASVQRWRAGTVMTPFERRLLIVAAANFAAIAGFFLINNTHNGFIFACLALVPVVLAVLVRDSLPLLALVVLTAVPNSVRNVTDMLSGPVGKNEPLLVEVRRLQQWLGPRDVLITPGTPFPETLYLAHLNLFELSDGRASHPSPEVPVLHAGPELQARIAWWRAQGGRVFYALGDESTDFTGDVPGAAKALQVFWRPEHAARERAPRLQALRAGLNDAGITLQGSVTSPAGLRYAELVPNEAPMLTAPAPPPDVSAVDLSALFLNDAHDVVASYRAQRARYLARLAETLPGDPWHTCDVMQLICEARPRRMGQPIPCQPSARCASLSWAPGAAPTQLAGARPGSGSDPMRCFWGKLSSEQEEQAAERYLAAWVEEHALGRLSDWGFGATGSAADLRLVLADSALALHWKLSDSCEPGPVSVTPTGAVSATAVTPAQWQDLVAALPIPKVRAADRSDRLLR